MLGQTLLNRPEGRSYLESAWDLGSIDAAGWLARSLAADNVGMTKDPVAADAYHTLYGDLVAADFESRGLSDRPLARAWMEADASGLAELHSQLRPHELEAANAMSKPKTGPGSNSSLMVLFRNFRFMYAEDD